MLREIRKLYFSDHELRQAIQKLADTTQRDLPELKTAQLELLSDPHVHVGISKKDDEESIVKIHESELVAAMIMHCNAHDIPTPKRAQKSLEVEGDQIILRYEIEN